MNRHWEEEEKRKNKRRRGGTNGTIQFDVLNTKTLSGDIIITLKKSMIKRRVATQCVCVCVRERERECGVFIRKDEIVLSQLTALMYQPYTRF